MVRYEGDLVVTLGWFVFSNCLHGYWYEKDSLSNVLQILFQASSYREINSSFVTHLLKGMDNKEEINSNKRSNDDVSTVR